MKSRLKNGIAIALIPQIVLVKWLGSHPQFIETYYSQGIYPIISQFFRSLFGWIPISIGDCLYFLLSLVALGYIFHNRKSIGARPKFFFRDLVMVLSVAYFSFHILWGFNYYREPIADKLGLSDSYTQEDLEHLAGQLVQKSNNLQFALTRDSTQKVQVPYTKKELFQKTIEGYQDLGDTFPFLAYVRPSIKTSLFSTGLSYMGYGGYLNPFTHEGQVNGKLPLFRFPVVVGHEIGHQVGFSAENETNLIGYLVTSNHKDLYFQYAAAAYATGYCLSEIKRRDEILFQNMYGRLHGGVQKNFQEMAEFWKFYENPLEPVFKQIFDSFLKANSQQEGIQSYNSVVSLMVGYHKKNPL